VAIPKKIFNLNTSIFEDYFSKKKEKVESLRIKK
jgi:hypothetical protein